MAYGTKNYCNLINFMSLLCDINYIVVMGKNLMLRLLNFHCLTGNTVEPDVVKLGFCFIQFTVTLPGHRKLIVKSEIALNRRS